MAKARTKAPNFLTDVCRIYNHMSLVSNGKVFALGGTARMLLDDATKNTAITDSHLRIFDFTKPIEDITKPPTGFMTAYRIPNTVPKVKYGNLFPQKNGTLTLYGGTPESPLTWEDDSSSSTNDRPLPSDSIWSLTIDASKKLGAVSRKSGLDIKKVQSYANVAWDPVQEVGWSFGGKYVNEGYVKGPNPKGTTVKGTATTAEGLLTMYRYESRSGKLTTLSDSTPNAIGSVNNGQLVYIGGVGTQGILVLIGGYRSSSNELRSAQEVHVYDIASRTWFAQPTTADNGWFPEPRQGFCAVAASAGDKSSHNIFIYGGYKNAGDTTSFDDIYVLSLPSFHWIMVSSVGSGTQSSRHTCEKLQERYMLVYGGTQNIQETGECKALVSMGLRLFDLWNLKWTTTYRTWGQMVETPAGTFRVPGMVSKYIGGNDLGGANVTGPERDFSDPQLAQIFKLRPTGAGNGTGQNNPDSSNTSNGGPTHTGDPENQGNDAGSGSGGHSKSINKGAIAGGVVGGLIALGLLIFLFLFIRRRKQKRGRKKSIGELSTEHITERRISTPTTPVGINELSAPVPDSYYQAPGGKHYHNGDDDLYVPPSVPVQIDSQGRHEAPDTSGAILARQLSTTTSGDGRGIVSRQLSVMSSGDDPISPVSDITVVATGIEMGLGKRTPIVEEAAEEAGVQGTFYSP